MTSPTVSNCTNEPQIESKEKMRQRMAKVSLALKGSPKVRVVIDKNLLLRENTIFPNRYPMKSRLSKANAGKWSSTSWQVGNSG